MVKVKRPIKEKPYDNCEMLSPAGESMAFVSKKSMNWYLRKNLATRIDEKTFQLIFEPNGKGNQRDVDYQKVPRKNQCVVCGTKKALTMHHIVPYCYRKFFPLEYKNRNSFDIMCMCDECHDRYEQTAQLQKNKFAQQYGVSNTSFNPSEEEKSARKALSLLNSLKKYREQMPAARIEEIESFLYDHYGTVVTEEELDEKIVEQKTFLDKEFKKEAEEGSKKVLESFLSQGKEIIDFVLFWREHFLKYTKPQHLDKLWLQDYKKREW